MGVRVKQIIKNILFSLIWVGLIGLTVMIVACGGQNATDAAVTSSATPKPVSTHAPDKIVTCDSIDKNGAIQVMPNWELSQIALGHGLPTAYYKQGLVKPGFCKPEAGVWTFPESGHHFFDASPELYKRQNLPAADVPLIEKLKRGVPESERYWVKWMIWNGQFIVFELKPNGMAAEDYFPYQGLPANNSLINVKTGEPFAGPGQ